MEQRWRRLAAGIAAGALLQMLVATGAETAAPPAAAEFGDKFQSLSTPRQTGGRPLLDALRDRRSVREFSPQPLPAPTLSDLLWAAFGVNRAATGQRTAPSTMNLRAMDLYLVTAQGAWRYDAERHGLQAVASGDLRGLTGGQDFVKAAPVTVLLVADERRLDKVPVADRAFYEAVDAGAIVQNIYLFCASEQLGGVVHMPGNQQALAAALGLDPAQKVLLAHAVGYPAPARGAR